jgi:hypothetical protein
MKVLSVDGLSKLITLMKGEFASSSSLSTVATSGSYNDLSNKPTIPSSVSDLSDAANYVTTNTAQNITAIKTFVGEKRIYFKQSSATDKLGFTLTNSNNTELATFEYRPNTVDTKALLSVAADDDYVGFRYWYGGGCNIIAPRPTTAANYYIPVNITNGSTTVTANNTGTVNISSLIPDALPSQTGNSGKYLTTNGTTASWITVTIPSHDDYPIQNSTNYVTSGGIYNKKYISNSATNNSGNSLLLFGGLLGINDTSSGYNTFLGINCGQATSNEAFTSNITNCNMTIIGYSALGKGNYVVAVGYDSMALNTYSIALGYQAKTTAESAIQLGRGTNTESNSFYVGFATSGSNYKLLGSDGKIPDDRLNTTIARTSQIPSASDLLPSQSGNNGKFLTTNGTAASWATVTQPSIATTSAAGLVKPDGTTVIITNDGTISASSSSITFRTWSV